MRSKWFAHARPESNGLLIPGLPRRRAADLLIAEEGVTVAARTTSAHLPWSAYPKLWSAEAFASGRGGAFGVALKVEGELEAATAAVRANTRAVMNFFSRALEDGVVVPLRPGGAFTNVAEQDTL